MMQLLCSYFVTSVDLTYLWSSAVVRHDTSLMYSLATTFVAFSWSYCNTLVDRVEGRGEDPVSSMSSVNRYHGFTYMYMIYSYILHISLCATHIIRYDKI